MQLTLKNLLAVGLLTFGLAACGSKEANQMEEFADKMCACKDADCAEKLFEEVKKIDSANEGKKVSASAAEKYAKAGERLSKCYADIISKGPAKGADKKEDKKEEKKEEKKE
jgi:hypothetical protein